MPTKADKQDLVDLENRINDRINEIVKQLLEMIPNKEDLAKKFAGIHKRLRELFEMIKNR
jgi:hypothetical protein